MSPIKDYQFVNDRMSFFVLQAPWYKYSLLNILYRPRIKDSFYNELENLFAQFLKYDFQNSCRRFQHTNRKRRIFRSTIELERLHDESNGNAVRVIHFASSKNLIVKNKGFKHLLIHKPILRLIGQIHN